MRNEYECGMWNDRKRQWRVRVGVEVIGVSQPHGDWVVSATRGLEFFSHTGLKCDKLVPYTRFFEGRLRDDKASRPPVGGWVSRKHSETERNSQKRNEYECGMWNVECGE